MVMSRAEAGRRGAFAAAERMTPQQRKDRARKAHLASAVSAVINRIPDLTLDQLAQLNAALGEVKRNDR